MEGLFTAQCPFEGLLLVKDDAEADGGFLIPLLLRHAIHSGFQIVFYPYCQPESHYQRVMLKLGVNLARLQEEGHVAIVKPADSGTDLPVDLKVMVRQLAARAESTDPAGLCIIFDSLSELKCLDIPDGKWQAFLLQCLQLDRLSQGPLCLAALVHQDVEVDRSWIGLLEHHAQAVIEVAQLESGHSPEVTGQMIVTQRRFFLEATEEPGPELRHPPKRSFYYKVLENGVRLVPRSR